ncbi:MAG TPA: hypothetical protein VMS88_06010 [Terriglobales bacterium]|nr:hypothetical protein [Terriglobales bacterium]
MRAPLLLFERRHERLLPFRRFLRRLFRNGMIALVMVIVSLAIGIAGYRWLGGLGWIDALYNASMILGGMGPVASLEGKDAAKIFASLYALFSGVALLTSVAVLLAPIYHRFIHHFHLEVDEGRGKRADR